MSPRVTHALKRVSSNKAKSGQLKHTGTKLRISNQETKRLTNLLIIQVG